MSDIHQTIDVDVPVRTAYNQWTQFETFPEFMDGVKRVVQLDDRTLEWTASIAGKEKQWQAEITEQRPDQLVAWRSTAGARNAGTVTFQRLDDTRTRVGLSLDVEPDGPLESAGDATGFVDRRVKADLERFKAFIESRGQETGAWRGSVGETATMAGASEGRSSSGESSVDPDGRR